MTTTNRNPDRVGPWDLLWILVLMAPPVGAVLVGMRSEALTWPALAVALVVEGGLALLHWLATSNPRLLISREDGRRLTDSDIALLVEIYKRPALRLGTGAVVLGFLDMNPAYSPEDHAKLAARFLNGFAAGKDPAKTTTYRIEVVTDWLREAVVDVQPGITTHVHRVFPSWRRHPVPQVKRTTR